MNDMTTYSKNKNSISYMDILDTDNKLMEQMNDMDRLIYSFAGTLSKSTISGYIADIQLFFGVSSASDITRDMIKEVTPAVAARWRDKLVKGDKRRKISPLALSSVNKKLAVMSSFYTYLMRPDVQPFTGVTMNPFDKSICKRYVASRNKRRVLSKEEVKILLDSIDISEGCSMVNLRDYLLIRMLIVTGLRNAEIRNLKVGNIVFNRNRVFLRFVGKGTKEGEVLLPDGTYNVLRRYMDLRNLTMIDKEQYLFVSFGRGNSENTPITSKTLCNILNRRTESAGIVNPLEVTAHSFRHSYATIELASGASIEQVADRLRHKSVLTTGMYIHADNISNNKEAIELDNFFNGVGTQD